MLRAETYHLASRLPRRTAYGLPSIDSSRSATKEWDAFVETARGGDLVQTAAWGETKRALGFETCLVLVHEGDELVGGGHIIIKRFGPFGGVGYIARGPLSAAGSAERTSRVLDEIERSARARRVSHLIVQPPAGGDYIASALATRGYEQDAPAVAPTATLRIDLAQSLDRILARMSASRRRDIRRSQRRGIEIRLGDRQDVDLFHSLYEATARRQGFDALSRSYLRHQWDALHPCGWAQLILAYHQGRPLAAVWLTAFGDTTTERLAGWTGEHRELQPNVACRWAAIQRAKEHGYRYYDFGGLDRRYADLIMSRQPLPDEFLRSPAAFKREFGADPVLFPAASQFTFNPAARFLVRRVCPWLLHPAATQRVIHRLRSGAVRPLS